LPLATRQRRTINRPGKKTTEAIHQEIAREVDQLLRVIFSDRRKTGRLDLEAIEAAVRSAMHRAGAAALTEILRFPEPDADRRTVACVCASQLIIGNCVRSRSSRPWAGSRSGGPTTYARTVTPASSPPMSN
jgi:hypothetical protein